MVLAFTRMSDLYGPKCKAHGLEIFDQDDKQTEQFKLWCRKCDGLTPSQIASGMKQLEFTCSRNARSGDESWPPSYAEFIGHCTSSWETAAHKPFEQLALPRRTDAEYREIGKSRLAQLRAETGL